MIKVDGREIQFSKFPNGETLVDTTILNEAKDGCRIDFKWEKDEDILHLYFVLSHLNHECLVENKEIYIYYMPYSRMDRSQNGSCFTLAYIINLLNDNHLGDKFYIVEPHSDKTTDMLLDAERINAITPLMQRICSIENIDVICYPDKGAKARFQDDKVTLPVIYCEKVRDFDTGEIKGLELKSDIDLNSKNVLILDDLCSKGGTFYYTAKKLKENGAKDVFLGVCHMEDTVTQGELLVDKPSNLVVRKRVSSVIKHIYCFDTMFAAIQKSCIMSSFSNITIYDIEKFLKEGGVIEC